MVEGGVDILQVAGNPLGAADLEVSHPHFSSGLVPQHHASGSRSPPAHHVPVAAADITAPHLEDDAVIAFPRP